MSKEKKYFKSSFIEDSAWNIATSVIGRVGSLIFTIIVARALLPEKFGLYSLAMSVALIFLTLADLGINQAGTVFISSNLKKIKKAQSYLHQLVKYKIIISLIAFICLILISYPLSKYVFHKTSLFYPLLLLSLYVLVCSIEGFFELFFFMFNKVKMLAIKEILFQVVRILMVLFAVVFFHESKYILLIIGVMILTNIGIFFFVFFTTKKWTKKLFAKSEYVIDKGELKRFIIYSSLNTVAVVFFGYIDVIMLGIFVSSTQVGLYRSSTALIFGIASMLNFYNVLLPKFSKSSSKENLEVNLNKVFKYLSLLSIPAVAGLIILGKYIMVAIYGSEFAEAGLLLRVLAPLLFVECVAVPLSSLFVAYKKPKYVSYLTFIAVISNIILNYIFIVYIFSYSESLAALGVILATLTVRAGCAVALFVSTKKIFNISLNLRHIIKPLIATAVMCIFLLYSISLIGDMNVFTGAILIIVSVLIYFSLLYLLKGFSLEDIFHENKYLDRLFNK